MTRFLEQSLFLTILLLSLLTIAIRSEGAVPRSELVEDDLRRLHQDDLGEWPGQIAVAVFPDDSDVAGLALPGSHPIRPRNQYRRRRKRPRPQVPQDRPVYLAEGPENSYPELIPHQPHHSYIVPDPPQRDEDNSPETTIYDNSQPSQRPQKPQIKELSYSPTNKPNIQNDKRQPSDSIFEDSKDSNEEDVTFDINNTDTYNPNKSPRKDQNEQAESSEDSIESSIKIGGFKPSIHTPNNSHRKPYSAKSHGQNIESPSPQDLKALLKQQSGSLSLSEILQQKNLSLADLLKGNRNALSALTGTRNSPPENLDDAPPRRLPPASGNARLKHQNVNNNNNNNNNNQRPHRYSVKNAQILDDYSSEPTVNRRLPPINGAPSRKNPYLTENQRPIRYREQVHLQDQEDEEIPERINKFVPSSPRRTTTAQPSEEPLNNDKDFSPSTDSSIVTNSIIPEDSDLLSQSALFNQNKKKENKLVIEQKDTANIPTTEHNKIIVEPPEPIQRDSSEFTSSQQTIEQKPKSDPIPLTVQETENLDPLHNSEAENTNSDHKRLRGKYPSRHRISVAQSPNGNNKEDAIANRVRLPPPNVFLSALRPKINNRVTTTDQPTMKATETTTEVNSVQKDDISVKISTTTPMVKSENANAVILEPKVKQHNSFKTEDDDDGNVIVWKPKISIPIEFRHDTKNKEHENDGPMHKVIPFQIETSTKTNKIKSTSARDELLEFLKTDTGSIRLARILASRNMTLAELIDHRERGSSQQHLAEIFKETTQSQTALTNDPEDAETISTQDTLNNDDMFSILKNFQESISTNTNSKSNVIPSLHEMFGLLNSQDKSHNEPKQGPEKRTESITEGHNLASRNEYFQPHDEKPYRESRIFESLPTFPHEQPLVPIHRPNYPQHPQMVPQWNPYQNPSSIYSFEPVNPYINSGQRPIITSRLTTTSPHTPVIEEITDGIILLENIGHVRELGNKIKGQTHRDDNKRFDGTYRQHELEDEVSGGLPKDVKSAIIVSSAILGAAILGFLAIFVVCRWRQRQARRRYVDGIVNTRARSPILMQPEGKQCSRSLSPVMVSSHDLYKRELSTDGEDETTNPGARRYYLWRTIRKTLKYK